MYVVVSYVDGILDLTSGQDFFHTMKVKPPRMRGSVHALHQQHHVHCIA